MDIISFLISTVGIILGIGVLKCVEINYQYYYYEEGIREKLFGVKNLDVVSEF